jgi:hypothetical protein
MQKTKNEETNRLLPSDLLSNVSAKRIQNAMLKKNTARLSAKNKWNQKYKEAAGYKTKKARNGFTKEGCFL